MFVLVSLLLGAGGADVPVLEPAPAPRAVKPAAAGAKPFDLTYMPRTSNSVLAVRPSELIKHFGEQDKAVTDYVRRMLAAGFAFIDGDLKAATPPAIGDIEQIIVSAKITLAIENQKDGRGSFGIEGVSSGLVRTAKPFDWAASIKKWFPKSETIKHTGREYVRVPIEVGNDTTHLAFFVADDRTLAFDTDEDEIKGLLARLEKNLKPAVPAGWDEVCRDQVALCHDTTADGWLTAPEAPKRDIDRAMVTVARKSTGVALGFSAGDRTTLKIVATARDECDAQDVRAALKSVVVDMASEDEVGAVMAKLFAETTVSRAGSVVRAKGEVKGNLLRRMLDPDAER
jgi:hypothetical protein